MSELVIHSGIRLNGSIPSGSGEPLVALNSTTGVFQTQPSSSGNPFADNQTLIKNSSDPTKLAILSAANITTGTTRTYILPDADGELALVGAGGGWPLGGSEVLTGDVTIFGGGFGVSLGSFTPLTSYNVVATSSSLTSNSFTFSLLVDPLAQLQLNPASGGFTTTYNGNQYTTFSDAGIDWNGTALSNIVLAAPTDISLTLPFGSLKYTANYVANYTDRSIPDYGNVWKVTGNTLLDPDITLTPILVAGASGLEDVTIGIGDDITSLSFLKFKIGTSLGNLLFDSDSNSIVFTDTRNSPLSKGIEYAADYSADFTDRSLVDWGNVWKIKGTTTFVDDVVIENGVHQVSIGGSADHIIFADANAVGLATDAVAFQFFKGLSGSVTFEDGRTVKKGIEYGADYSTGFTTRSLVDKGYVTSQVTNGTYTPTLTNGTNVAASSVPNPIRYTKIGNVVTVTGIILLDITTASSPASLQISLPIAKDFTDNAGIDFGIGITLASEVGRIISDPTNDTASLTITSANTSNQVVQLNFTYVV